jgi:uncharacterized delta-60 repeat protein
LTQSPAKVPGLRLGGHEGYTRAHHQRVAGVWRGPKMSAWRTSAVAVFISLVAMAATPVIAGSATLDSTFGGDGKVITDFGPSFDGATAVAIQADGKIVAVGGAGGNGGRFALARYDTDGTLDATFGGDGKVRTDFTNRSDVALAVAIQADGKIVAAGDITRFTPNGVVGRFALARYDTNGTLDPTFGGDGRVTTSFTDGEDGASAVAIQADGKILAAGSANASCFCSRFALARYDDDGTLDATFGGDGKVTTRFAHGGQATAMAIQADGKIVAAGSANASCFCSRFALARYDDDGTLDATFGGDGKVTTRLAPGG